MLVVASTQTTLCLLEAMACYAAGRAIFRAAAAINQAEDVGHAQVFE